MRPKTVSLSIRKCLSFKPGDLVKFKADRADGALKVTELVAR